MRTKLMLAGAACVMLLAVAACSFAADVFVPAWRGTAGTTFQQWDFTTDASPAAPEMVSNAYGTPSATTTVGAMGAGWLDQLPGMGSQTGYWDLGSAGEIALDVSGASGVPYRDVWVQVTYFADLSQAPIVAVTNGVRMGGDTRTVEDVDTGGSWILDQTMWRVQPAAGSDTITVTGDADWGSLVDSIVVDTMVVPEPASLMALALGCCGVLLRRRRA